MADIKGKSLTIFGCGYLGSAFARMAIEDGMKVAALTRIHHTANCLRELGVNPVIEAVLDSTSWHRKLNPQQDFVLNCVGSSGGGLDGYHQSYFQGQSSILNWASEGRVGTYIFTSSTSVYPQSRGKWIDEGFTHEGVSEYGKVLLDAERLLIDCTKGIDRYFILRLAGIYGPERHHLLDQLRKGRIRAEDLVERHLNIIHRDDICSAIYACLLAPAEVSNQIFNLADDRPEQKKNLLCWLGEQLGIVKLTFQSKKESEEKSQEKMRSRDLPDRRISNKKIKSILGWSPVYPSFKEGYQDILN